MIEILFQIVIAVLFVWFLIRLVLWHKAEMREMNENQKIWLDYFDSRFGNKKE